MSVYTGHLKIFTLKFPERYNNTYKQHSGSIIVRRRDVMLEKNKINKNERTVCVFFCIILYDRKILPESRRNSYMNA